MTAAEPHAGSSEHPTPPASERERLRVSQEIATALDHELRGPVFGITSASQLLRYRIADDPVVEKNIGRIMRETERLGAIVEALLEYGRADPVNLVPGNPDHVWTTVLAEHRGALEAKALLAHHTSSSPTVTCDIDTVQLSQAFSAALINAIDAATEGSDLVIRSSADSTGGWTSSIHNDGPPIAPYLLDRVFDLLVGNKPGHPGIGLAITHRVISYHGGVVSLESTAATGTTLTFTLPASHG
jgi:signal transduction histidine kinase